MVTKNQIKLVISLQQKKYRSRHGLFVAEGIKTVNELLEAGFKPNALFLDSPELKKEYPKAEVIPSAVLKQMSNQTTPSGILGVFFILEPQPIEFQDWILAVDSVRDPGNLGTIIRLCDWFGIRHLLCSEDTVDCYNPKVLQATMGSIARINIVYSDLNNALTNAPLPIYGAFMNGNAIYNVELPKSGILVMGNEANGISKNIEALVNEKISIPQFGKTTTESLNVATATAILLNEIRR